MLAPLLATFQQSGNVASLCLQRKAASRIAVVASDVDGTLLNSRGELSARTAKAIADVQAAGVPFIVATGKCRAGALNALGAVDASVAEQLASLPGVFTNGLCVYQAEGNLAWEATLNEETIAAVEAWTDKAQLDYVGYASGDRLLTTRMTSRTDELHFVYREPRPEIVPSLRGKRINKILILGDPACLTKGRLLLDGELCRAGIDASLTVAMPQMLEVLPPGCSKGDGLKRLLELEGLADAPLMSMGDAENDLGMLRMSTTGVAMANAAGSEVIAAARGLQTLSNDEDGAALALEALLSVGFDRGKFEQLLTTGFLGTKAS